MGKSHPTELRSRVIAFVEEGHGHREAARHVRVSPRFVKDMVILQRATGGLALKVQGNDLIFLPPYSPDPNPIETAFSKLKTLIRKAAARPCQALWKQVGAVCDLLFPPTECRNDFIAAGYRSK